MEECNNIDREEYYILRLMKYNFLMILQMTTKQQRKEYTTYRNYGQPKCSIPRQLYQLMLQDELGRHTKERKKDKPQLLS